MVMRANGERGARGEEDGDGGGETVILELGELKSSTRRRHLWSYFSLFLCVLGSCGGEETESKKDERS